MTATLNSRLSQFARKNSSPSHLPPPPPTIIIRFFPTHAAHPPPRSSRLTYLCPLWWWHIQSRTLMRRDWNLAETRRVLPSRDYRRSINVSKGPEFDPPYLADTSLTILQPQFQFLFTSVSSFLCHSFPFPVAICVRQFISPPPHPPPTPLPSHDLTFSLFVALSINPIPSYRAPKGTQYYNGLRQSSMQSRMQYMLLWIWYLTSIALPDFPLPAFCATPMCSLHNSLKLQTPL